MTQELACAHRLEPHSLPVNQSGPALELHNDDALPPLIPFAVASKCTSPGEQEQARRVLQQSLVDGDRISRDLDSEFLAILNQEQRAVQHHVEALSFKEGSWYRTYHNRVVPLSMILIVERESLPVHLVFAAQLHDTGYALVHVASNLAGAAWENVNIRTEHPRLGAEVAIKLLTEMKVAGQLSLTAGQIGEICDIIRTHDDPYLGIPLTERHALAHRDADKVFVMSCLSFWKDYLAHLADAKYLAKAEALGIELTPRNFLRCRASGFYTEQSQVPVVVRDAIGTLDPKLASYNEGGICEPQSTPTGKMLIDQFFAERTSEVMEMEREPELANFAARLRRAVRTEYAGLLERVSGNTRRVRLVGIESA